MYDELVKRLHKRIALSTAGSPLQDDLLDAADAIEELSSQFDDFKRLCLPLKENRLYKFADGSFTEVSLMIVPREPTEPPKEE